MVRASAAVRDVPFEAIRNRWKQMAAQEWKTELEIMRGNIDTDVIIRIERLVGNSIRGTLGKWAFGALRYLPDGSENPEFILNREPYRSAEILITGPNFGCGSSREGAVWSLQEMGIRAVIGSSFGDIFFANCFQNGILPVVVDKEIVDGLAAEVQQTQGAGRISIDLEQQTILSPSGQRHEFAIDPRRREGLLEGLVTRQTRLLSRGFGSGNGCLHTREHMIRNRRWSIHDAEQMR
jgi:3-isopropylmalate/(R)-2-methylmalate dehydratase small subunit